MTENEKPLVIEVSTGLAQIIFYPGMSTGPQGSDTCPGIGFDCVAERVFERHGKIYAAIGVIGRTDAARLYDMLGKFLGERTS